MKNTIIILFLFACIFVNGQTTDVKVLRIANATTTFGSNISIGNQVYNISTSELWVAIAGVLSSKTLTTSSSSFTLLNAPETDPFFLANVGDSVIANEGNITITESQISDLTHFVNADETDQVYASDSLELKTDILANYKAKADLIDMITGLDETKFPSVVEVMGMLKLYFGRDTTNAHVSGLINGTNDTFTTFEDYIPNTVQVSVNGVLQNPGVHYHEVGINGLQFETGFIPGTGEIIKLIYKY